MNPCRVVDCGAASGAQGAMSLTCAPDACAMHSSSAVAATPAEYRLRIVARAHPQQRAARVQGCICCKEAVGAQRGRHSCSGHQETGQDCVSQISFAYSAMVRSLENFPELATLTSALFAQLRGSA